MTRRPDGPAVRQEHVQDPFCLGGGGRVVGPVGRLENPNEDRYVPGGGTELLQHGAATSRPWDERKARAMPVEGPQGNQGRGARVGEDHWVS